MYFSVDSKYRKAWSIQSTNSIRRVKYFYGEIKEKIIRQLFLIMSFIINRE